MFFYLLLFIFFSFFNQFKCKNEKSNLFLKNMIIHMNCKDRYRISTIIMILHHYHSHYH
jgi:uncharacterized protein YktB (UPF0637 family)